MSRHRSRYRAVQILYQIDMRSLSPEEAIRAYYDTLYSEEHDQPQRADEFMEELVSGTFAQRADIDSRIEQHSANWKLDRMPVVDRNLLRMAVYEILAAKTPPAIVIDEALELARRMSGDEAVKFVNGVLDAVRKAEQEAAGRDTSH
jgi:transcription antitermination protein NusB